MLSALENSHGSWTKKESGATQKTQASRWLEDLTELVTDRSEVYPMLAADGFVLTTIILQLLTNDNAAVMHMWLLNIILPSEEKEQKHIAEPNWSVLQLELSRDNWLAGDKQQNSRILTVGQSPWLESRSPPGVKVVRPHVPLCCENNPIIAAQHQIDVKLVHSSYEITATAQLLHPVAS